MSPLSYELEALAKAKREYDAEYDSKAKRAYDAESRRNAKIEYEAESRREYAVQEIAKPYWGKNVDRFLREWDYKINGTQKMYPLTTELTVYENAPWWACEAQGHSWQANISTRISGRGCPFCAKP